MKATVLESADGRSVILAEDGLFYSTDGIYETGEIIEYEAPAIYAEAEAQIFDEPAYSSGIAGDPRIRQDGISRSGDGYAVRRSALSRRIAAIAACLVIALSVTAYSYQNLMVYADVTLDGDMPVTFSLNRKGEIIRMEPADENGRALAEDMRENGMKGKSIEKALEYAEKYMVENDTDNEAHSFSVTVECRDPDEGKKMSKDLNNKFGGTPDDDKYRNNKSEKTEEIGETGDSVSKGQSDRQNKSDQTQPGQSQQSSETTDNSKQSTENRNNDGNKGNSENKDSKDNKDKEDRPGTSGESGKSDDSGKSGEHNEPSQPADQGKPDDSGGSDNSGQQDRTDRTDGTEKNEKTDKPDQSDKGGSSDHNDQAGGSNQPDDFNDSGNSGKDAPQ